MLERIKNSILNFPERNAFYIEGKFYTYTEFAKIISRIRYYLQSNTSKEESLIGITARHKNEIENYAAIYGSLFSGKGYIPINPANPLDRNSKIIEQTGIKTILTGTIDENVIELARYNNIKVVEIPGLPDADINLDVPEVDENEIAYILFTSGSTGVPKGVPITRKNLNSFIDAFYSFGYEINEQDRFLQMFELTFDFSVACYTIPLCVGACAYTLPADGIKFANVYTTLEEHEITFACMVPSVLSYLKPYFDEIKLDKVKHSLFCGEILYEDITSAWSECVPNSKIINAYGPTEATVFCLTYEWNKAKVQNKSFNGGVAIGKPMQGMDAVIIGEDNRILARGQKGELCLTGNQLTNGYWRDPAKNTESFFSIQEGGREKTFYKTGDSAFVDEDGDFMFAGRLDNQIKIQGFRIELGEIEHFARQFTNSANVAAIAFQSKLGTMQIHLFVESPKAALQEMTEFLRKNLPEYMLPTGISFIPAFPLNTNGKIDRKGLLSSVQDKNGIS